MNEQHSDTAPAMLKILVAWFGAAWGAITMQTVVLALTAIYTVIQIYILVRDKIVRDRK